MTGLVQMHDAPSAASPILGALKGGTRFYGTPELINGGVWLKLETRVGVSPPIFGGKPATGDDVDLSVGGEYKKRIHAQFVQARQEVKGGEVHYARCAAKAMTSRQDDLEAA